MQLEAAITVPYSMETTCVYLDQDPVWSLLTLVLVAKVVDGAAVMLGGSWWAEDNHEFCSELSY